MTQVGGIEAFLRLIDNMSPELRTAVRNADAEIKKLETQLSKPLHMRGLETVTEGVASLGKALNTNVGVPIMAALAGGVATLGGAFLASAVSMVSMSSATVDLADKFRISTDVVQKYSYAADQSGTSVGSLLAASSKLAINIGSGSAEARAAVTALGLSFEDLRDALPEQQLAMVLEKVSAIKNPTEQAAVASDLLGKGFRELIPLGSGLGELTARAEELGLVLSEKDVRAAEELGDSIDTLMSMFRGLVNNIGAAITSNKSLHVLLEGLTGVFANLSGAVKDNRQSLGDYVSGGVLQVARGLLVLQGAAQSFMDVLDFLRLGWSGFVNAALQGVLAIEQGILAIDKFTGATDKEIAHTEENIRAIQASIAARSEEANAIVAANSKRTDALELVRKGLQQIEKDVAAVAGHEVELAKATTVTTTAFNGLDPAVKKAGEAIAKFLERANYEAAISQKGGGIIPLEKIIPKPGDLDVDAQLRETAEAYAKSFAGKLEAGMKALPNVIVGAIQGGGDVLQAAGAHMGGVLGDALSTKLADTLTATLGKSLGGLVGSAIPVVGTLLGGAVGGLIDGLFGGDKELKQVREMREEFIKSAGGIEELERRAEEAGVSLDVMLNAKKVHSFEGAMKQLQESIVMHETALEDTKAAAERYGLTIEELGPKFRQQQLDEQFGQLLKDWKLLEASGADMVAVANKMAPSMNEYLQAAIKTGAEVPKAMEPTLQKMLEMGLLVDENGVKLENLDGVSFAETMTESIGRVVESIDKLVAALLGIPYVGSNGGLDLPLNPMATIGGGGGGGLGSTYMPAGGGPVFTPPPSGGRTSGGGGDSALLQEMRALRGDIQANTRGQSQAWRTAQQQGGGE